MSDEDTLGKLGFRAKTKKAGRSRLSYETKKGAHGTLYLYEIEYSDKDDPDTGYVAPIFRMKKYAYDDRHIIDWAREELGPDDWKMRRFARVQTDKSRHRWNWHK